MKKYSSIKRVNSRRTSQSKRYLVILVFLLVSVFLMWLVPKFAARTAAFLFSPIHQISDWLQYSSASLPSYLRDRNELNNLIVELESRVGEDSLSHLTIQGLKAENDELKKLLQPRDESRILAGVIARPNQTPYDVIVLDRGSNDGVVVGSPVYVASTTVVGLVTHVFPNTAVVKLMSSPGFRTTVYIYGPNIYTNAEGIGGGVMRVGVPQGIKINEGDTVIVPSVELGIFGEINTIESNPSDPEQFGFVTTEVPLNQIRLVSVGRHAVEKISFNESLDNIDETIEELLIIDVPAGLLVDLNGTSTPTSTDDNTASSTPIDE